jgi:nitroreductase
MQRNEPKVNSSEILKDFIPYQTKKLPQKELLQVSASFKNHMSKRRSIREFSSEDVPAEAVLNAIAAACSAPSGANKQPWHFCLIKNEDLKMRIREKAEKEELKSYSERMNEQWLKDLEPLGTDHIKPFIQEAPYLIVVFKKPYELVDGKRVPNYYVNESVGIATGILIAALHNAGLATLTHTPSPMNFLHKVLERPENERAYLLMPVGYPKKGTTVPNINRKPFHEVMTQYF